MAKNKLSREEMIAEMEELKPWHQRVQITEDLNTEIFDKQYNGRTMVNHRRHSSDFIYEVYKDQMLNKTMLDCGCNAGAHLYEAAKMGIKRGLGFDTRELWINQASWLKENISIHKTDHLEFKLMNIFDIPKNNIGKFDITMYSGLLYHVEEPFLSLKVLSDVTNELLIINTAYEEGHDQEKNKDCLYFKHEGVSDPLSGVHGVSWLPSGERVIMRMLRPLGFSEFYLMFKRNRTFNSEKVGRLAIAASKIPGMFDGLESKPIRRRLRQDGKNQNTRLVVPASK